MNEFWSIILGALIAIGSGIITSLWNGKLERQKQNNDAKKICYYSILRCCNSYFKYSDEKKGYHFDDYDNLFVDVQLYASKEIIELFQNFVETTASNKNKDEIDSLAKKTLQLLRSRVKKELKLK